MDGFDALSLGPSRPLEDAKSTREPVAYRVAAAWSEVGRVLTQAAENLEQLISASRERV